MTELQDDYAERLLGDPDKPSHIMCGRCETIKPTSEFKKKLSRAQANQIMKRQTNTTMYATSKYCKECREPRGKISPSEYAHKLSRNLVPQAIVEMKEQELRERRAKEKTKKLRRSMAKRNAHDWNEVFDDLRDEIKKVRNKRTVLARKLKGPPTKEAEIAFAQSEWLNSYATALTYTLGILKLKWREGKKPDWAWEADIPQQMRHDLITKMFELNAKYIGAYTYVCPSWLRLSHGRGNINDND
jgi:Na+-translocating ferredoxin:NAD+ oxidoreductase RnfC subunit